MGSRGAGFGAVIGLLGGALASASGQQIVWRPAERPPVVRAVSPGAALGRPTAAQPSPAPFPPAYRDAGPLPPVASTGTQTIATVPPPGAVIATSGTARPAPIIEELDDPAQV